MSSSGVGLTGLAANVGCTGLVATAFARTAFAGTVFTGTAFAGTAFASPAFAGTAFAVSLMAFPGFSDPLTGLFFIGLLDRTPGYFKRSRFILLVFVLVESTIEGFLENFLSMFRQGVSNWIWQVLDGTIRHKQTSNFVA
jgi:hypothetical protein